MRMRRMLRGGKFWPQGHDGLEDLISRNIETQAEWEVFNGFMLHDNWMRS